MTTSPSTQAPRRTSLRRLGTSADTAEADTHTFVTFDLGAQVFAVDVGNVREILDAQTISALPNATSEMLGMIDIRGQGIPVMDLSLPLGLPRLPHDQMEERLIVLDFAADAPPVAIAADRVRSVIEIADHVIDPVPAVPGGWNAGAMKGVTRLDGQLVYMLDLRQALQMAARGAANLPGPFDFD